MQWVRFLCLIMFPFSFLFSANFTNAHVGNADVNPYSILGIGNDNLWVFSNGRIDPPGTTQGGYPSNGSGTGMDLALTLAYDGQQFISLLYQGAFINVSYDVYTNVVYTEGMVGGPYVDTITFTFSAMSPTNTQVTYTSVYGGTVTLGAVSNDVLPFTFTPNVSEVPAPTIYPNAHFPTGTVYRGINLPGFEFSPPYPPSYLDGIYYVFKGMNVLRIPFSWENIQPDLGTPIDWGSGTALALATFVENLTAAVPEMTLILDMHNYMRYNGNIIGEGGSPVTATQYGAAWGSIATQFSGNTNVIFDLMNEPHDMATELILSNYNTAILDIRNAEGSGFHHLLLLEGNGYTCLGTWTSDYYGTPNSTVFVPANIQDSHNNYAINVHEYFDGGSGTDTACGSGETAICVTASNVLQIENFNGFTSYLEMNGLRAILTELNAAPGTNCVECVQNFLTAVEGNAYTNSTGWGFIGWTAWASLNISPADVLSLVTNVDGTDRLQWTGAYNNWLLPPSWTP